MIIILIIKLVKIKNSQPLTCLICVYFRLNSLEDLMANPGLMAEVKDVLKLLPDLERLLKKYDIQ